MTFNFGYYLILFAALVIIECIYMNIASRFNIGADVTLRSSHKEFTITGGGIIFIISAFLFRIAASIVGEAGKIPESFDLMLGVGLALGVMSFIDDMRDLKSTTRLFVQTVLVGLTFAYLIEYNHFNVFLVTLIIGVGFVNAYNFMDGITGMLVAYTLVSLGSLYVAYVILPARDAFMLMFISSLAVATLVFAIFNFRHRARVFCGDVGAIEMGFLIFYISVNLIIRTHDASYAIFFIVYGVDTIFTIFERLFKGENILTSHQSHLYQALTSSRGMRHRVVSCIYAGVQLLINVVFFSIPNAFRWSYDIIVIGLLIALYFIMKRLPRSRDSVCRDVYRE